ncbi:uncharacterized protein LOC142225279 [Haematobia irritans]|uniref:uncharacterized protein LOC142225279 n=1 Tax=Haematobia irritans TaxID=7368 RepID=UPI003F4FB07C
MDKVHKINKIRRIELINRIVNYHSPKNYKERIDPFLLEDDQLFKRKYRFTKNTVKKSLNWSRKTYSWIKEVAALLLNYSIKTMLVTFMVSHNQRYAEYVQEWLVL